jgi:hypothetical protein
MNINPSVSLSYYTWHGNVDSSCVNIIIRSLKMEQRLLEGVSRCSLVSTLTKLQAGRPGLDSSTTASRPALGPIQPPIQWVPGALSLGVKQLAREGSRPGRGLEAVARRKVDPLLGMQPRSSSPWPSHYTD